MKFAFYTELGGSEVLKLGETETPEPGPMEVRVKIAVSGVNPSDWKARERGRAGVLEFPKIIPQSDGAGIVDSIGGGVSHVSEGDRVWVLNGQWQRPLARRQSIPCCPQNT